MSTVVSTVSLTKTFHRANAVDGINLSVESGRVYGLLGPNGAGKSTTMKMLLGLLTPTAGEIQLFGSPWHRSALGRIGASIDGPSIYGHLSARQNLEVHAHLLGVGKEEIEQVLSVVDLERAGRKKTDSFSTGMKGRLALAIALLGGPDLLILDEPQNGLDPEGISALRKMLRHFTDTGRTVILSSHLLGEVAHVADDIGVIIGGRLHYQGTLQAFAPDGDLERAYFHITGGVAA